MGDKARDFDWRRASPSQCFDYGLKLSERAMEEVIRRANIPEDLPAEERARRGFRDLREANLRGGRIQPGVFPPLHRARRRAGQAKDSSPRAT